MQKAQPTTPADQLDETDIAILRALSADARLTNKALAARLGLAESTCAYRVRALRENGVTTGTSLNVDLSALGFPIQAVIKVRLGSHNKAHVPRLFADLANAPGVIQAFHVAGEDDFHLHVAVESPRALRDLVLDYVTVHKVVRQSETQLVFEHREGAGVLPPPT